MDLDRYNYILGLDSYTPKASKVCFLPWLGEFGWYIFNQVKRVHGYNHNYKIVCIKPGHECLFPTAQEFFYDWDDIEDSRKAGVNHISKPVKAELREKLIAKYGDDIQFVDPSDTFWIEKETLAHFKFIPKPQNDFGLETDVVLLPRHRNDRNWNPTNWQALANALKHEKLNVGVCGSKETTLKLKHIRYYAYDHVDIDSDVEMMSKTKIVVGQDSGLIYLAGLCRKPVIMLGHMFTPEITKLHLDDDVYFKRISIPEDRYKDFSQETIDKIVTTISKFERPRPESNR